MSWIIKKKSQNQAPWFEKRTNQKARLFKNLNRPEDESLSQLNSKLKERLEAFARENGRDEAGNNGSEPIDKVVYSEDIKKIRIHGLEKPYAEPENGRTFTLGYPYSANTADNADEIINTERPAPAPRAVNQNGENGYNLNQSTLKIRSLDDAPTAREERTPPASAPPRPYQKVKISFSDDGSWLLETNGPMSNLQAKPVTGNKDYEILDQQTGIAEAEDDEIIFTENETGAVNLTSLVDDDADEPFEQNSEEVDLPEDTEEASDDEPPVAVKLMPLLKDQKEESEMASITPVVEIDKQYSITFQSLKTSSKLANLLDPKESQHVIATLEETLNQFGIEGRVMGIQRGPIITRYEIKMAPGIKVSRILGLSDELAMALEAVKVRIEAPIPGRSTVGIEIPNKKRASVLLGDILNDPAYREFEGELPLPLGKDIAGNLVLTDLVKLPHLLIAGATGSGKSVSVNSFITNLIMNKSPEEVRLLLVDPKLVELSHFNDIPHLLHPVITDPPKAIQALSWAVEEMERRYEDMAELRARDIRGFNEKVEIQNSQNNERLGKKRLYKMPYIICLIDELGDLMMVAGKEVEGSIIRLSQKARAVGIHLILATQRPSVDVITALIKANCPARIALQVAQKTDSRTILDGNGAEQLLGSGDLLFKHPSKAQLLRIQAPLITDDEVEAVVKNAKEMGKPRYIKLEDPKGKAGDVSDEDEALFEEAWGIILESGKASASYLQRRLRIGYNRAARLVEAFEARGLIGPQIGSKPREILVNSALN